MLLKNGVESRIFEMDQNHTVYSKSADLRVLGVRLALPAPLLNLLVSFARRR
jgi:hypothetical protein